MLPKPSFMELVSEELDEWRRMCCMLCRQGSACRSSGCRTTAIRRLGASHGGSTWKQRRSLSSMLTSLIRDVRCRPRRLLRIRIRRASHVLLRHTTPWWSAGVSGNSHSRILRAMWTKAFMRSRKQNIQNTAMTKTCRSCSCMACPRTKCLRQACLQTKMCHILVTAITSLSPMPRLGLTLWRSNLCHAMCKSCIRVHSSNDANETLFPDMVINIQFLPSITQSVKISHALVILCIRSLFAMKLEGCNGKR